MSQADFWYVRFPDGRILRAGSTAILRQELGAGHIPIASTVRRSPNDAWMSLEWTQEFADVVERLSTSPAEAEPRRRKASAASGTANHPASAGSARLDPSHPRRAGVRGDVDELLAALDCTVVAKKILLGGLAGLFLGGLLAVERASWFERDSRWFALTGVAAVALAGLIGLIARLTYVELSRLRPARWSEGLSGLGLLALRLILAQAIVCGSIWGLIVLLRWLPYWLSPISQESPSLGREIVAGFALSLGMILEVGLVGVFFFWWLVPPILAVEECSVLRALRQWLALLKQHFCRVLLYQMLAIGLSLLLAAPFVLLIAPLFLPSFCPPERLRDEADAMRSVLLGLAFAPALTFWIVANMFVYLNLRYGASNRH